MEKFEMNDGARTIWCIRAGRTGEAETLFLKKNFVALGWTKMGDLSKLMGGREAFKAKVAECYPDKKPMSISNNAGQLFRFVHEMRENDVIVYPSKLDHQIHLGRVCGPYRYDPSIEAGYPHLRPVKWVRSLSRTRFTQGALYEIGASMSLFQVKTYGQEFLSALEDEIRDAEGARDETVAWVAEEIENTTRDFVIKQLAQELKGKPLEEFVAHLLQAMGYRTRVSPEGKDAGIDIIAHKDELGFEPPIIKVQVKSVEGSVGDPVVSALYGKVGQGEFGLLVTLGTFTSQAQQFARGKGNLRLIDGQELVDLVFQHYEKFDSRYKGLIPLKRVHVPEPLEEPED